MKKFVFALTLVSALVQPFVSASAADFEPPPPTDDLRPATYDWSGMYVGASVAYNCADGEVNEDDGTTVTKYDAEECAYNASGFTGYNHQFDQFVVGIEANLGFNKGDYQEHPSLNTGMDWTGDLRARFGVAHDNTLLYASVGYAGARGHAEEYVNAIPPAVAGWEDKGTGMQHGYLVGMGIEHALTDVIRIRAEYNYMQFGWGKTFTTNCGCTTSLDNSVHAMKLGVSYAF
jgi:outer membrane immunogenic protein